MLRTMRGFVSLSVALSMALITPAPVMAEGREPKLSPREIEQIRYDQQLAYWGTLDHEMPEVAKLGFDEPMPTWRITSGPLLDQDPFFMRAQAWESSRTEDCGEGICFAKDRDGVLIALAGHPNALRLKQALTPVLETSEFLFMSADGLEMFRAKSGDQPGEGLFFVAKKDLLFADSKNQPVPVFFFPLPGEGWTGQPKGSFEFVAADKVVIANQGGFGLPIDNDDILLMEKMQRQNLVLAQTFSFLDGQVDARGIALPKPNSTLAFGLILSGLTTQAGGQRRVGSSEFSLLPKAYAEDQKPSLRERIMDQIRLRYIQLTTMGIGPKASPENGKEDGYTWDYWKKWLWNGVLYGGTAAVAYGAYEPVDFSNMITADMPERIATVAKIIGGVALASVAMKYTIHRAHFDKLYPKKPEDSMLRKLNQEHKGLMSELAHGLYFSLAVLPQGIRHALEFLKDHFIPGNKMVYEAWEATMGYQMKQNSHLAMNYKTQYFGWLFGLADSVLVGVYLLIFGPWLINHYGWDIALGGAGAAFASAEVLRNFLAYLQSGAHGYSAEVKFIHLKSAENEARNRLRARGENPDAARNSQELLKLTEEELEKRYKTVGLPGREEFLYDPITLIEGTTKAAGFRSELASQALPDNNFVLKNRHWGIVGPALKRALNTARDAQKKAPSEKGAKVVQLLEWASKERSATTKIAGRVWDAAASKWGADGLRDSIDGEVATYIASAKSPDHISYFGSSMAFVKGAFKYLVQDSSKEVRDIREVLYLMSTAGNASEVMKFIPKSWREKAGSDEASAAAAELFHRAFFSYYEHDEHLIEPDNLLEAEYGSRARNVLARAERTDAGLKDPFLREIRYRELMHRLKTKDESRRAISNYRPQGLSEIGQKQWSIARAKAMAIWSETRKEETPQDWLDMGKEYVEITRKDTDDPADDLAKAKAWSRAYRYRLTVARAFAREVGLEAKDTSESDFVKKVLVAAAASTDAELGTSRERSYASKLSSPDRDFYEAQVFTRHFVDNYVNLSVHSDEHLQGNSPEYPGKFQKVRKALVGAPGEKVINGIVRSLEALFRNEETAYRPGVLSWLDRNIPLIPDMVHNFIRNLRILPYGLTISYVVNWYVWQIHSPYSLWCFSFLIAFLNPTLVEMNNRFQRNHGYKPMGDVPSKLLYGWIHSFLTNPELILVQSYSQPIVDGFDKHVVKPVQSLPEKCMDLLTPGPRRAGTN